MNPMAVTIKEDAEESDEAIDDGAPSEEAEEEEAKKAAQSIHNTSIDWREVPGPAGQLTGPGAHIRDLDRAVHAPSDHLAPAAGLHLDPALHGHPCRPSVRLGSHTVPSRPGRAERCPQLVEGC